MKLAIKIDIDTLKGYLEVLSSPLKPHSTGKALLRVPILHATKTLDWEIA